MRILVVGIFKDHELGSVRVVEKGLRQNGCAVECFDYQVAAHELGNEGMEQQLIARAQGQDLVFICKGQAGRHKPLRPGTLATVRQEGAVTVLWYGDMRPRPEPWLLALLPEVDFYFMAAGGAVLQEYFRAGRPGVAAFFFEPADPELAIRYQALPRCQDTIAFTGRYSRYAGPERKAVLRYLRQRPDVRFYGGSDYSLAANLGIRALNRVWPSFPLQVPVLRGEAYIAAIKRACIGVGVSAFQDVPGYTSDRLIHFLTFGTFFLPWKFPGIERFFEQGRELIWFESIDELDALLRYYLAAGAEREAMAQAAQSRVLTDYNPRNIVGMMLDIIQTGRSDRFPWVEVYS